MTDFGREKIDTAMLSTPWLHRKLERYLQRSSKSRIQRRLPVLQEPFSAWPTGHTMQMLLRQYDFSSVLDLGCGSGEHACLLAANGKQVSALNYTDSAELRTRIGTDAEVLIGDFNSYPFNRHYDCIWCSHVLEHQPDPHSFLLRIHELLPEGGILALTVPPLKHLIVSGHTTLWNPGLLLYHLVLAGFDCTHISLLQYGYNISAVLRKTSISSKEQLVYNTGDLKTIQRWLPQRLVYQDTGHDIAFDGRITRLNWPD